VKLYIANKNYSSWSLRPWVLLHMLQVPFEEVLVPFVGGGPQPAFHAFSPTGKVPCLELDGVTVWESLAIMETVAERHPSAWPEDWKARAWARAASAEMHAGFSLVRQHCSMSCGQRVALDDPPPGLLAEWQRMDALWTEGLERFDGPFLAGPGFTIVDAFFAPVAFRILTYAPALSSQALDYAQRLRRLPPMQRWYDEAIEEPWRDEDHERDVAAAGTVLEDFRRAVTPARETGAA
jgi:glutathione S-transferase